MTETRPDCRLALRKDRGFPSPRRFPWLRAILPRPRGLLDLPLVLPFADSLLPFADSLRPFADSLRPFADSLLPFADSLRPFADSLLPFADLLSLVCFFPTADWDEEGLLVRPLRDRRPLFDCFPFFPFDDVEGRVLGGVRRRRRDAANQTR